MDEAPGLRGESSKAEIREHRHIKRLALARMFRLMSGLMRLPCPETKYGNCYWCGVQMHYSDRVYIGDLRGHHQEGCPWKEVLDYKQLEDEWEVRGGGSEARVPETDGDPSGEGVRPVD